jgi:hypothetical protein
MTQKLDQISSIIVTYFAQDSFFLALGSVLLRLVLNVALCFKRICFAEGLLSFTSLSCYILALEFERRSLFTDKGVVINFLL